MKVVTTAEMRALEQAAVEAGATWPGLMEQAGRGVAELALELLGGGHGRSALVLVGPGNNGGDGLVAARHLHDAGARVALYLWRRRDDPQDANLRLCRERAIPEHRAAEDPGRATLRALLEASDLAVDALLGIGVSRPVEGELAEIVETLNAERRTLKGDWGSIEAVQRRSVPDPFSVQRPSFSVLSVDIPTGVHSDTGAVLGCAVRADATATAGLLKRGLLLYPGRAYAGALHVVAIDLVPADVETIMSETIDARLARGLLPPRPDDSHKGTFGKVMVLAGSAQYPGAAVLATAGAARVGAGLVTLATGRSALAMGGRSPEITLRPLPEAEWGVLGEAAADEALKAIEGYRALLVGPGIGREKQTGLFLARLLGLDSPRHRGHIGFRIGHAEERPATRQRPPLPPAVVDADALNLLAQAEGWWERVPRSSLVLTPHPLEMKRLLGTGELPGDLVDAAAQAAARWGQVVVLKGATTVVADPEGRTRINDGGNAALATAGTGDVLSGAIAGLLAQGLAPFDAATLGVYLHSAAGRILRDDLGDMGTIAGDLLPRLPLAIKALKRSQ
ncbi:MAG TPA: NAD(P)H-hydrate dehydratase [Roseiflexaceae bacterium]|nr:NAD(P)H-hydrate dehydratase [Roseiflexaceae bacterium]